MAGRDAPDSDARTRKSAAWLRAAMLSYRMSAPPGVPSDPDVRVSRLLARARAAGVLGTASNEAVIPKRAPHSMGRWLGWPQALAASVVLCAVGALLIPGDRFDEDADVMRGAPVQTFTAIDAASASARRDQMLKALRAAGLDAQPYERLGRPGIDAALDVPLPAKHASALKAMGIAPPQGPSLQIEFIPTPSAK